MPFNKARRANQNMETTDEQMTVLAIRIPSELRERIKAAAAREHRTESSFGRFYLERAADAALAVETSEPIVSTETSEQ